MFVVVVVVVVLVIFIVVGDVKSRSDAFVGYASSLGMGVATAPALELLAKGAWRATRTKCENRNLFFTQAFCGSAELKMRLAILKAQDSIERNICNTSTCILSDSKIIVTLPPTVPQRAATPPQSRQPHQKIKKKQNNMASCSGIFADKFVMDEGSWQPRGNQGGEVLETGCTARPTSHPVGSLWDTRVASQEKS